MKTIVRNVRHGVFTCDSRLDVVPLGKVFVTPERWMGGLGSVVEAHTINLQGLIDRLNSTPYSIGHKLTAEPAPQGLDLGRIWNGALRDTSGALRDTLRDNVIVSRSGVAPQAHPGSIEATAAVAESEKFHEIVSSPLNTNFRFQASDAGACLRRLGAEVASITRKCAASTSDSRSSVPRGVIGYSRPIGDGSRPVSIAAMNEAASRYWSGPGRSTRTGDSAPPAPRVRVPIAPSNSIERMAQANREFWAARR